MTISVKPQDRIIIRLVPPQGTIGKQSAIRLGKVKKRLAQTKSLPIENLKMSYAFRDKNVTNALLTTPELIYILLEASVLIRRIFGDQIQLSLETNLEGEANSPKKLFAYIVSPIENGSKFNQLVEFDEQWWLSNLTRAKGLLNFHLEYS